MTITLIIIIVVAILAFSAFEYFTRPIKKTQEPTHENTLVKSKANNYYQIDDTQSQIEFAIGEILAGSPLTALGHTRHVEGYLVLNKTTQELSFYQDQVKIDARTLRTNNDSRDNAIKRFVLETTEPENYYITFSLTQPLKLTANTEPQTVNVTGKLTISGVTKEISFQAQVTSTTQQLTVDFKTELTRSEFEVKTPEVPFVAKVDDNFQVTGHLIAKLK